MYELLYTSTAPAGLSDKDLRDILDKSRAKNLRLGVTGMLLYYNREIVQILEGEEEAVKSLYQEIADDERHTQVRVFYEGAISERAFSHWSMAYAPITAETVKKLSGEFRNIMEESLSETLHLHNNNRGKEFFLEMRNLL